MKRLIAPVSFPSHRKSGAALIVILAFVVLLAVVVLAFFSRAILERQISNASANQTKVDLLALGAVDIILGDLKQEIQTGSEVVVTNGVTLYYPLSPTNMIPARSGHPTFSGATNDPIPNLIRRSVRNDLLAPDRVGTAASAVNSTTDPSLNGRFISLARWNSHYLIPRAQAGNLAVDSTPTNSFVAPDWVMVTSSGPKTLSQPDSTVIGRYAYAIYDEGGLLDVNVAGFPSGLSAYPNAADNVVARKGSAALADLTVLGLTGGDNLVGWRNYATAQPAGALGSYTFPAASLALYHAALTNAANSGFLAVSTNGFNGRTDQVFPSRQAFLKFQRAAGFSQDALQYLGTFSRTLEQPSFRPDPARPKNTTHDIATVGSDKNGFGGNDAYDPSGERQDAINPSFLAVRHGSSGQPVARSRFPLSRLGVFDEAFSQMTGGGGLTAERVARLKDHFGLEWDAATACWEYDHGSAGQILRLEDVPEDREPDFLEMLKAAIHCDSLGKQLGGTDGANPGSPATYSPHLFTNGAAALDGKVNHQIVQIAANLIDQYDEDSYPTRIRFDDREFYGVENLPYLNGWMQSWYRMRQLEAADINPAEQPPPAEGGGTVFPYETWVMYQPILWNPHAPDFRSSPPAVPSQFQITAGGTAGTATIIRPLVRPSWWQAGPVSSFPAASGWTSTAFSDALVDPATSILTFSAQPNTSAAGAAAFQEPYRLCAPNVPAGSNAGNAAGYPEGRFTIGADPVLAAADGSEVIGFFGGKAWTGPSAALSSFAGANESSRCLSNGYASGNLRFQLQYQNPYGSGPAFLTYDVINQVFASTLSFSTVDNTDVSPNIRAFRTVFRIDPRTNRWGLFETNTFPLANNPADMAAPESDGINGPVYHLPQATTLLPHPSLVYRLKGNNNGLPQAPGWLMSPQPSQSGGRAMVADTVVNLTTGNRNSAVPGNKAFYSDPDGVLRRADGAFFNGLDGIAFYTGNFASRPVVLNRPFRSVVEMGYAFRGTPWKSLDFFTPESGDAALLDAFCLHELAEAPENVRVAGRVNLNTRQPLVLEALLRGAAQAEGEILTVAEAAAAARELVMWTADATSASGGQLTRGPLRNRSELVGKWVSKVTYAAGQSGNLPNVNIDGAASYSGFSSQLMAGPTGIFGSAADAAIKRKRESVLRALADSGDVRTWNLLIDVVAQTGRFSQAAGSDLSRFTVEGEARYWVHVALDRLTGEVIAREFEPVTE